MDNNDEEVLIQQVIEQHSSFGLTTEAKAPFHHLPGIRRGRHWNSEANFSSRGHSNSDVKSWKPRPVRTGTFSGYGRSDRSSTERMIPVHAEYVCHLCGEKGHHINNCYKSSDPKKQKKIKPATGIPRSWLKKISRDEISENNDVFVLPDGGFAILKSEEIISSDAYFTKTTEQRIKSALGISAVLNGVEALMTCSLCSYLFKYPVILSCCGDTFCRDCIERCEVYRNTENGNRSSDRNDHSFLQDNQDSLSYNNDVSSSMSFGTTDDLAELRLPEQPNESNNFTNLMMNLSNQTYDFRDEPKDISDQIGLPSSLLDFASDFLDVQKQKVKKEVAETEDNEKVVPKKRRVDEISSSAPIKLNSAASSSPTVEEKICPNCSSKFNFEDVVPNDAIAALVKFLFQHPVVS